MTHAKLISAACRLTVLAFLGFSSGGCGGSMLTSTAPPILRDREEVISALPKGITLDMAVVPDKMYGESSKTVEDALRSLNAYVRNGVLYDGGMGHQIQFDPAPPSAAKKTTKKLKGEGPPMIIKLAK
jgi:hypothetical protein